MAMYLFLPWLFLLLYPNKSCWRVAAVWLLSVLAGLAFLAYVGGRTSNNFLLYVPCFLPGVIAYQLQRTPRRQLPAIVWPGVVIGVVLLYLWNQNLVPNSWIKRLDRMPGAWRRSPFFAQISAPWLTEPSRLIAKYSYGIYLTHFFCIWLAFDRLHYVLPRAARLPLFAALVASAAGRVLPLSGGATDPVGEAGSRRRFEQGRGTCHV